MKIIHMFVQLVLHPLGPAVAIRKMDIEEHKPLELVGASPGSPFFSMARMPLTFQELSGAIVGRDFPVFVKLAAVRARVTSVRL